MSTKPTRPARFSRFERVKIIGDVPHWENLHDRAGTVIWSDYWVRPHSSEGEWLHVVYVPSVQRYPTVRESLLESRGGLDPEDDHRGSRFEISYDLVMDEDMPFIEGTFRCPGGFWEVFIFTKGDRDDLSWEQVRYDSHVAGIFFDTPKSVALNRKYVVQAMSKALCGLDWLEVHGPDSIILR